MNIRPALALPLAALAVGLAATTTLAQPKLSQPRSSKVAPPSKAAPAPAAAPRTTPSPAPPAEDADAKRLLASAVDPEKYPNASKATLLDLSDIVVRPDGTSRTVTHQAIQILTIDGRESESEVQIPYNGAFESVRLIRARTIRPDGSVVAVRPEELRTASPSEYDDAKVLSFSLPAVEPGCIVDYEYVTDQSTPQIPGHFWSQWYFQGGYDPVRLTRLTVTVPKSLPLHRQSRASKIEPTVTASKDGKSTTYVWEQKDVPPFGIEPMMPPSERLRPKLTLTTLADWQQVATWYAGLAKGRDSADATLKARADAITRGLSTPEEKARAIFYWVQDKTRYVAIELGVSAYQPRPASRTLQNQYGDCKDMATLLVALLRAEGIDARLALLEADNKYPVQTELAAPSAFNHAICMARINDKTYWLDATAQVCPFGVVPDADRGCETFVIHDGKGEFVLIPDGAPDDALSEANVTLTLAADGSAKGTIALSGNGDYAMALRAALLYTTPDKIRRYLETLAAQIGGNPKVIDYKLPDYRNLDAPVAITMTVEFPAFAIESGDLLLFKARTDQVGGNFASPLTADFRVHPLYQSSPRRMKTRLAITLPAGADLLSLPKNTSVESLMGRFERSVTRDGATLTVSTVSDDFHAELSSREYDDTRRFFRDYMKAYNEFVVVRKQPG